MCVIKAALKHQQKLHNQQVEKKRETKKEGTNKRKQELRPLTKQKKSRVQKDVQEDLQKDVPEERCFAEEAVVIVQETKDLIRKRMQHLSSKDEDVLK